MEVNEKLSEVKEKVIKEGRSLFWRYGVKSVTMDDIARHLGMSKKTLYQFFTDKDDLISRIMESFLKREEDETDALFGKAKDSIDALLLLSTHIKSAFQNMTPSLMYELKKYHPNAFKIFREHKRTFLHESIIKSLIKGVEEGVFRKDMNLNVLAKLRLEQIEMGFDREVFPPDEFQLDNVQLQLFEHFIHGITTLKGHRLLNEYRQVKEEEI
jgi:TetR/AcrR family transcriptional regulator, cholesterol catabolism regulator